ncbi:hypothetical protein GPECTOR_37g235 [Gonium pectorale]|uniref:Nucleotide-diphospho-sugar transferase domain-containing protein n=1 Tax=Gonium pectorale TaxID=33097 RepID=A0A150GBM2_GONPE|nr:hypothetical protein GPECTOR_37g235 [Gonium pectorale]|eukprot:KXZ47229.1 hypothetical protein GPECTOR_37g235 [Gonium pectorale]
MDATASNPQSRYPTVLALVFALFALSRAFQQIPENELPQWRRNKAKLLPQLSGGDGALPCEASGMCSIGRVRPFQGDTFPLQGLRDCLHARSFRREVILFAESRLTVAFQVYHNLLSLGYAHIVLLAPGREQCARAAQLWPDVSGCAWYSQAFGPKCVGRGLLERHALLPRAVRLGYNVLMLDSYAQNARPDGPAAYLMAEVIDRLERWSESDDALTRRELPSCCWEQMTMSDALLSTVIGRPVAYGCWDKEHNETYRLAWEGAHKRLFGYKDDGRGLGVWDYMADRPARWPASLAARAPGFDPALTSPVWMQAIQVPNTQGVWPPELGGQLYPAKRGPRAQAWIDLLKSDGPPLWPDPEDPHQAGAAANVTETFAFLPDWFSAAWGRDGVSGYWHPSLLGPNQSSPLALAHFCTTPGGSHNKFTVRVATGAMKWELWNKLRPNGGVYFASSAHAPVPDVLSYGPGVEEREWSSYEEWDNATKALARLAMEMGRAAALPAPRCNVSWLGGGRNNKLPLDLEALHRYWAIPTVRTGPAAGGVGGFDALRCMLGGYLMLGCLASRWYYAGGLLAPEYDHFLTYAVGQRGEPVATADAVLLRSRSGSGSTSGSGSGSAWDVEDLARALMAAHGGPGAGLLHPRLLERGGGAAAATAAAANASRPRLLLLPEVPLLTDKPGPRAVLYGEHEVEDFNKMSCPWIQNKPFS